MFAEEEDGSSGDDAVMVAQLGLLSAFAVHPRAVLGAKILEQVAPAFAHNEEMAAGKGFIVDFHIGRFVSANGQRLLAKFPALAHRAVIA